MKKMKNLKSWIGKITCSVAVMGALAACEEDIFNQELYIKIFGLLCDDNNIYEMVHPFGEEGSERFVSVICGGSQPLEQDVTITLEVDGDSLLQVYNEREYALDTMQYAKVLDESRYEIPSLTGVMKAGQADQYLRFPITVKMDGLSPDTVYFIPLRIANVSSGDSINASTRSILYRPTMKNTYADQATAYTSKGYSRGFSLSGTLTNGAPMDIGVEKILYPVADNQVRVTIANYKSVDVNGNAVLSNIESYSVIVTIENGSVVSIEPYRKGSMTVEMLSPEKLETMIQESSFIKNYTDEELDKLYLGKYYRNYYDNTYRVENGRPCIFLCYRYQTSGAWTMVQERLRLNVVTTEEDTSEE